MILSLPLFALLCALQPLLAIVPEFHMRPLAGKSTLPVLPINGKVSDTERCYAAGSGQPQKVISLTRHKEGVQLSQFELLGSGVQEGTLLITRENAMEFTISRKKAHMELVFKKTSKGDFSKDFKLTLSYPNECESSEVHKMNLEKFLVMCGFEKKKTLSNMLRKSSMKISHEKRTPAKKLAFTRDPAVGKTLPKVTTKASSYTIVYGIEDSDERLEQHLKTNAINVEEDAEEAVAVFTKAETGVGIEELIKVSGGRVQKFTALISTEEYPKFTAKRYSETVLCVTFKASGENAEDFGILLQHTGTHQEHKAMVAKFLQSCGFEKITGRIRSFRNSVSVRRNSLRRKQANIGLVKKSASAAGILEKYLDARGEKERKRREKDIPLHWRLLGDTLWAKYGKRSWEKIGKGFFIRFWDFVFKQMGKPEDEEVDLMEELKNLFHSMTEEEKESGKKIITKKTQELRKVIQKDLEKRGLTDVKTVLSKLNTADFRKFMETMLSKEEKDEGNPVGDEGEVGVGKEKEEEGAAEALKEKEEKDKE